MNTQTVEEQVAAFDEVLLLTLFDIICRSAGTAETDRSARPKTRHCTGFSSPTCEVPAGEKERSAFSRRNGTRRERKTKIPEGMGVREKPKPGENSGCNRKNTPSDL